MTYTGYENFSIDELIRQIEHEGPTRAAAQLIKCIETLQDDSKESTEEIDRLAEQVSGLEEQLKAAQDKYESLNELLEGETA